MHTESLAFKSAFLSSPITLVSVVFCDIITQYYRNGRDEPHRAFQSFKVLSFISDWNLTDSSPTSQNSKANNTMRLLQEANSAY